MFFKDRQSDGPFFYAKKDKKGERNEENFKKDRRYAPDLYDVFSDLWYACKCSA